MFKLKPLAASIAVILYLPLLANASDTGDAPATYGLATHEVVAGAPFIGDNPPDDNDPVNSVLADGDDNEVGGDDEDGVFGHPVLVQNAKSYSTNVFVSNPTNAPANLVGWVDFDGNGVFDPDEATSDIIPAGADNVRIKLVWPDLFGLSTDFFGPTYGRFRVSSDPISPDDATASFADGEVEDYTFPIVEDSDGDEVPNTEDLDNDNDGIPDAVEDPLGNDGIDGNDLNTDGDAFPDYLDTDSDNDGIPDFIEAGNDANNPVDTDGDGDPDYIDTDSDNDGNLDSQGIPGDTDRDGILDSDEGTGDTDGDGILNINDIDSDNDIIPDAIERGNDPAGPVDTDGDLIPDFLDLDSDNDGIPDIWESNAIEVFVPALDMDSDGRADSSLLFGNNGFVDDVETAPDTGVPVFAVPDTDGDTERDFRDLDSDADGVNDVVEGGATDNNGDGFVDGFADTDSDGIPDVVDFNQTGGVDTDGDSIDDVADISFVAGDDVDGDDILDSFDVDANGDGIVDGIQNDILFADGGVPADNDFDFIPDFRDPDADGSGEPDDTTAGDTTTGNTTAGDNTAGDTTAGDTTAGDTTTGDTTAGVTDGGQATPTPPVVDNSGTANNTTGVVETGLSGVAGCSVSDVASKDPLFLTILMSCVAWFGLRRRQAKHILQRIKRNER